MGRDKTARAARERGRELAEQLSVQLRRRGWDAKASELVKKLRESEAVARAQAVRDELAEATRERVAETGLDERAAELAKRVRASEAAQRASHVTDEALGRLGQRLSTGRAGERLGVEPAKGRFPRWLLLVVGAAAGVVAGVLTRPKQATQLREELARRSDEWRERRATTSGAASDELAASAERIAQDTPDSAAPPAEKPLEDRIRTELGQDPRTSDLPKLNINVVEGTVFVRGVVPEGYDTEQIRVVIAGLEGVNDVDLQVGVAS